MASSVHPELGLVMTGGWLNRQTDIRTVEATRDGRNLFKLPQMPFRLHGHCQVTVDTYVGRNFVPL